MQSFSTAQSDVHFSKKRQRQEKIVNIPSILSFWSSVVSFNVTSCTRKLPTKHKEIKGTKMRKTILNPAIFASSNEGLSWKVSLILADMLWFTLDIALLGKADCMAARCAAVEIARPKTEPKDRNKFRVDVATARSSVRARAWTATRPEKLNLNQSVYHQNWEGKIYRAGAWIQPLHLQ